MSGHIGTGKRFRTLKEPGFRLFLFTLPFLVMVFLFSYLPLWGWSMAFVDYKPGKAISECTFVGLKYFNMLFNNPVKYRELVRVMKNTLGMSFLGILTSWLPMIFAIMLKEIRATRYRKVLQTVTTIPNFISWVLVYSLAFGMFSVTDGLVNKMLIKMGVVSQGINFLASKDHIWFKMWLLGNWKGLGWSAVIYLAALAGIDQELYEAARVDGAARHHIIRHIEIPGLLPTFVVLLILSIATIINSDFNKVYLFANAMNKESIETLDLYVYNQGIKNVQFSYTTAIGIMKSFVSIILIVFANTVAKKIRGESIL